MDGTVNMADWLPFFDLLEEGGYLCEADNGDGQINFLDAAGLQQRMLDQQGTAFTDAVADDSGAQAFLCGRVQLEAVAPGTIELVAGPNDLGIANDYSLLQSVFTRANISVTSDILLGDVNLDEAVNFLDITPFVALLFSGDYQIEADINGDEIVSFLDITPFIELLQ